MQRISGNFRVGIFLARREEKDLNILEIFFFFKVIFFSSGGAFSSAKNEIFGAPNSQNYGKPKSRIRKMLGNIQGGANSRGFPSPALSWGRILHFLAENESPKIRIPPWRSRDVEFGEIGVGKAAPRRNSWEKKGNSQALLQRGREFLDSGGRKIQPGGSEGSPGNSHRNSKKKIKIPKSQILFLKPILDSWDGAAQERPGLGSS